MDTHALQSGHLFYRLAHPSIQELTPYVPGKCLSEVKRELELEDIIKLASNENPLGASPLALEAAQRSLTAIHYYPDGSGFFLKQKLAEHLEIDPSFITLGNGSDNVLQCLTTCFLPKDNEAIVSQYSFATYGILVKAVQGRLVTVPVKKNWQMDIDAMISAVNARTRLIFIANPNNPTGSIINHEQLESLLSRIPKNVLLVLDEAYCEYCAEELSYPNSLKLFAKYNNLVITRTFSKAYGLAGLRVGYGISHPVIADLLNRVRLPFNVNEPAQHAAIAALSDQKHLQKGLELNRQGMQTLTRAFNELDLKYISSAGNFLTLDCQRTALPIFEQLLQCGIIVRPLMNYQLPNHLRISIGTPEQNQKLIKALKTVEFILKANAF